jgi:hypothetical protein
VCGCKNGGGACEAIYCGIAAEAFTPLFFSSGKVMSHEKWGMKKLPAWADLGHFKIFSARSPDFVCQIGNSSNCFPWKFLQSGLHRKKTYGKFMSHDGEVTNACSSCATTTPQRNTPLRSNILMVQQSTNQLELKTSADNADNDKESDQHQKPSSKVLRSMSNNKQSTTM